jgi:hypothetical protein
MSQLTRDNFNLRNWKAILPIHHEGFDLIHFGTDREDHMMMAIPRQVWDQMGQPPEITITISRRDESV